MGCRFKNFNRNKPRIYGSHYYPKMKSKHWTLFITLYFFFKMPKVFYCIRHLREVRYNKPKEEVGLDNQLPMEHISCWQTNMKRRSPQGPNIKQAW